MADIKMNSLAQNNKFEKHFAYEIFSIVFKWNV